MLKHIVVSLGPHGYWAESPTHALQQLCESIGLDPTNCAHVLEQVLVVEERPLGDNVMVLAGSWDGLWENHRAMMQQLQSFTNVCDVSSDEGTDVGNVTVDHGPGTMWIFPTATDAAYARNICQRHGVHPES